MSRSKIETDRHRLFESLYRDYCGRVYNFVHRLTHGNGYIAEEITQMVFLKIWEKMPSLDTRSDITPYLMSITRNTLLNYLKHQAVEYIYLNYLREHNADDCVMPDTADARLLEPKILELVNEMPPMRQKIFRMSRFSNMSTRQIAEGLGLSVSTVETHIQLALRFMRAELERRYGITIR